MHAGNDDEDEDADGEHQRHGNEALLCVEAAVLGCCGWGESGVVMCGLLSEGRDVTLVLLQGWAGSYSHDDGYKNHLCSQGCRRTITVTVCALFASVACPDVFPLTRVHLFSCRNAAAPSILCLG